MLHSHYPKHTNPFKLSLRLVLFGWKILQLVMLAYVFLHRAIVDENITYFIVDSNNHFKIHKKFSLTLQ
jgi:hypothetical protein